MAASFRTGRANSSRRWVGLSVAVLLVVPAVSGCSDHQTDQRGSGASASAKRATAGPTTGPARSGTGIGTEDGNAAAPPDGQAAAKASKKELAAARAASNRPSGVAGEPAPNDDDGARNLASVDPSASPNSQDTSGSVGRDPLVSPTPTFPEPGRPDTDGLVPLDWCDDLSTPFYRAVSTLNVNSTPSTIVAGVKDLTTVAARAQNSIAAAVQVLLTTAQTAAVDAARARDFGGDAYQAAVKAVHVYLGDACGR